MNFKYKVGDKVRVIPKFDFRHRYKMEGCSNMGWVTVTPMDEHCGEVVTIKALNSAECCYHIDNTGLRWTDEMFEGLAEEKKMFTKSDLKTGMFGVMNNGFKFVVVNDTIVYSNGEWDGVHSLDDNLRMFSKCIMKVYTGIVSFNHLDGVLYGVDYARTYTLVYDRERDTKPVKPPKSLYNGKVVCIDNRRNPDLYTVGKIYQFEDGNFLADDGTYFPGTPDMIYTFEDWAKWTVSKFIEIKE